MEETGIEKKEIVSECYMHGLTMHSEAGIGQSSCGYCHKCNTSQLLCNACLRSLPESAQGGMYRSEVLWSNYCFDCNESMVRHPLNFSESEKMELEKLSFRWLQCKR